MAKAKKKLEKFDPFLRYRDVQPAVDQLQSDKAALIKALTAVLEINQVRATMGFKPWICNACDAPHQPLPEGGRKCPPKLRGGKYQGECPHHNAARLLRGLGVELDPRIG